MLGTKHEFTALITGVLAILYMMFHSYPFETCGKYFVGLVIVSLMFSCDLDKENSRPFKRWWIFGFIWKPFAKAGHREILHHFVWGPVILSLIPYIVFRDLWVIYGLVTSIELHIITDKL